jgi:uncharacterized protein YbcI
MKKRTGNETVSTQEIEASVNGAMGRFLEEHLGERSETVNTRIFEDTIMVRFKELLPPAERHMMRKHEGLRMIKELKLKLIERAAPLLKEMIRNMTGAEVVDIHSSFNPSTGEHVEIFTLNKCIAGERTKCSGPGSRS